MLLILLGQLLAAQIPEMIPDKSATTAMLYYGAMIVTLCGAILSMSAFKLASDLSLNFQRLIALGKSGPASSSKQLALLCQKQLEVQQKMSSGSIILSARSSLLPDLMLLEVIGTPKIVRTLRLVRNGEVFALLLSILLTIGFVIVRIRDIDYLFIFRSITMVPIDRRFVTERMIAFVYYLAQL
jgi:hypothetical protein